MRPQGAVHPTPVTSHHGRSVQSYSKKTARPSRTPDQQSRRADQSSDDPVQDYGLRRLRLGVFIVMLGAVRSSTPMICLLAYQPRSETRPVLVIAISSSTVLSLSDGAGRLRIGLHRSGLRLGSRSRAASLSAPQVMWRFALTKRLEEALGCWLDRNCKRLTDHSRDRVTYLQQLELC